MLPAEVVVHEVERNRVGMVDKFLAERISKTGEPPHAHPHGEVLSLDVGRADLAVQGVTDNSRGFAGSANRGAVSLLVVVVLAKNLHGLSVVNVRSEGDADRVLVRSEAVG